MNVSVCLTTFNEERTIGDLIQSLLSQSKKPDEIVIVDSHSKDQTASIIRYYQKRHKFIKLITENSSRAKGRNIAVKHSENEIIAMTDAGCIAEHDWLEKITDPFKDKRTEIVAGFYDMEATTPLKKAFSVFLGITPKRFDPSFMPSTRSIAFTKTAWIKAGGFPENLEDTAEDTLFNFKAARSGIRFFRVKKARVLWHMPDTVQEYSNKIYFYALGDAKSGVWTSNVGGVTAHNIKVLTKMMVYLSGIVLFSMGTFDPFYARVFFVLLLLYVFNAFRKVFSTYDDWKAGLLGIVIQFITDYSSMAGFVGSFIPEGHERRLKKSLLAR